MKRGLLACAILVIGCPDAGTPSDPPPAEFGDAYVPLLTGKVAQVDPDSLEVIAKLGSGHSIVHGVAVIGGVAWVGNRDDSSVERVGQARSIPIGHAINRIVAAAGRVAVSGNSVEYPFGAHLTFLDAAAGGAVLATAEIPLDDALLGPTSRPIDDDDTAPPPRQECSTCPRTGVALHAADAWVVHTRNHALYRLDPTTGAQLARIDIPRPADLPSSALSPFLSISPAGRIAVPGLYTRKVHLFDAAGAPDGELSTGDQLAIETDWSPDGRTLYVLTAQSEVIVGDESHNAAIPTEILAVDPTTLQIHARATHPRALNHITVRPGGASLFATTAHATLLRFDLPTLTPTGSVQVSAGAPPALDIYF